MVIVRESVLIGFCVAFTVGIAREIGVEMS